MQYKTRGIILKRTNLGEADRIITILTEKFGKIRAVAKGVRKTLSKMAGHLEPFCLTNIQIAEGRNLDVITGVEVEESFCALRGDLQKTTTCFYFAEVIDKMMEEGENHPEIFNLLSVTLAHANDLIEPLLVSYFEINFLAEMGFRPELHQCIKCGNKITPEKNSFDFVHGGLVCTDCGSGRPISDETIKLIRLCLNHRFREIKKIKVDDKIVQEIKDLTNYYLKHIHQKDFKSEKYLGS